MEGLADRLAAVTRKFANMDFVDRRRRCRRRPLALCCAALELCHRISTIRKSWQAGRHLRSSRSACFHCNAINDLPGALVQVRRALKPDGLFVACAAGRGDTLGELRDAFAHAETATRGGISPRVSPFADVRDLGGLLQRAGFALPVADVERLTVRYGDFFCPGARPARPWLHQCVVAAQPASLCAATRWRHCWRIMREHHADADGKLRARFETLYLTGWTPHESQQQPLKPGSATARLADALGDQPRPLFQACRNQD